MTTPSKPTSSDETSNEVSSLETAVGSGTIVQKGNFLTALVANQDTSHSWIVDSGASDHMTGNRKLFNQFSVYSTSPHVRIADGSLSKVMGIGSVIISTDLTLNSILYVPKLNCNLLSVSKLIKDLNCAVDFRSNACVFQDLHSGKIIGSAKGSAGLYFLEVQPSPINKTSTAKLEKVQLGLQEEQKVCDAFKERYTAAVVEQRHCYSLLKAFQEE